MQDMPSWLLKVPGVHSERMNFRKHRHPPEPHENVSVTGRIGGGLITGSARAQTARMRAVTGQCILQSLASRSNWRVPGPAKASMDVRDAVFSRDICGRESRDERGTRRSRR